MLKIRVLLNDIIENIILMENDENRKGYLINEIKKIDIPIYLLVVKVNY